MKFSFICILKNDLLEGRHDKTLENFRHLMFTETNYGLAKKIITTEVEFNNKETKLTKNH